MNILFCGSCLPRRFESVLEMLSVAANQYQNNLINNLRGIGEVEILSYIGIPIEVAVKDIEEAAREEGYDPILASDKKRSLFIYRKRLHKMLEWADCVIVYNSCYPWFDVGKMAYKKSKKAILILADYTPTSEMKNVLRKVYSWLMKKDFGKYTKVVLLSSESSKYLSDSQERIVINGCIDKKKFCDFQPKKKEKTVNIVYSGVLSKITGVDLLLEAFSLIEEKQYRLIICGQGRELEGEIKSAVANDSRIIFKGFVSTDEYIKTVKEADILINPRNMNYAQNRNNFPSKVLEYIASGRPIVSTKFKGYEAYCSHIIFAESEPKDIAQCIQEARNLNFEEVFAKNRVFSSKFTWEKQIEKFL